MRKGASVVWFLSLQLMNSFNKTKAAVFSCRLCFLRAFPFISLIFLIAMQAMLHEDFHFLDSCIKRARTTSGV